MGETSNLEILVLGASSQESSLRFAFHHFLRCRSLVNPGTQSNAAKYKKCKLPACSSKHGGSSKKSGEIQRNFSTKSLMERFTSGGSGSEGPGYSPIRKCETVLALSEVQSEVQKKTSS